jgi:putative transposase
LIRGSRSRKNKKLIEGLREVAMLQVHKIELAPNNKQKTYFAKACGVARFAYNWGLAKWKEAYEAGKKPSEAALRRELNAIKGKEFPWMTEVTKVSPQQAIKNLGNAFNRFFKKQGKYPRYKKKGIHDAFRADNGPAKKGENAVTIIDNQIKLPRLGWVKMKESLRFKGQIMSVTISRQGTRWYAAINVECTELPHERKNHGSVGVDLGIKTLATFSNGESYEGPKAQSRLLKQLRRYSRGLSRKKRGSANYGKARKKLATLHARISHIRVDSLHKLTTALVLNNSQIAIEDLNVKGMAANRKLSRHIMDQSFREFRRQLTYKSQWYKTELIVVNRFYPSSKMCHCCGHYNQALTLADRIWTCICGVTHDRDLNAAINLKNAINLNTVSSTEINAYGENSADICISVQV